MKADSDQAIADRWGEITAKALAAKSPLPVIDGLLAATALQHNLTLVTHNPRGHGSCGSFRLQPFDIVNAAQRSTDVEGSHRTLLTCSLCAKRQSSLR